MIPFVRLYLSLIAVCLSPWLWRAAIRETWPYQTLFIFGMTYAWVYVLAVVAKALSF